MERISWEEICCRGDFVGRWVALSDCTYDDAGKARAGALVDSDQDLVELCRRLGHEARTSCDIVFCSRREHDRASMPPPMPEPRSSRPPSPPIPLRGSP